MQKKCESLQGKIQDLQTVRELIISCIIHSE